MKPKGKEGQKNKKLKIAVAVVAGDAGLENWQVLNVAAHLGAELGARGGATLLKYDSVVTKDNANIPLNIQHAIMIKTAERGSELANLLKDARDKGLSVHTFTREMLETTNDNKVRELTAEKNLGDVEFLGVLVFGEANEVAELTDHFSLSS